MRFHGARRNADLCSNLDLRFTVADQFKDTELHQGLDHIEAQEHRSGDVVARLSARQRLRRRLSAPDMAGFRLAATEAHVKRMETRRRASLECQYLFARGSLRLLSLEKSRLRARRSQPYDLGQAVPVATKSDRYRRASPSPRDWRVLLQALHRPAPRPPKKTRSSEEKVAASIALRSNSLLIVTARRTCGARRRSPAIAVSSILPANSWRPKDRLPTIPASRATTMATKSIIPRGLPHSL